MEEIKVNMVVKDAEIMELQMKNQQLFSKRPGDTKAFSTKSAKLKEKVSALNEEVHNLNREVKYLDKQVLESHTVEVLGWKCFSRPYSQNLYLPKLSLFIGRSFFISFCLLSPMDFQEQ